MIAWQSFALPCRRRLFPDGVHRVPEAVSSESQSSFNGGLRSTWVVQCDVPVCTTLLRLWVPLKCFQSFRDIFFSRQALVVSQHARSHCSAAVHIHQCSHRSNGASSSTVINTVQPEIRLPSSIRSLESPTLEMTPALATSSAASVLLRMILTSLSAFTARYTYMHCDRTILSADQVRKSNFQDTGALVAATPPGVQALCDTAILNPACQCNQKYVCHLPVPFPGVPDTGDDPGLDNFKCRIGTSDNDPNFAFCIYNKVRLHSL